MVIFSVSKLNFEIKSNPGKKNIHVNLTSYEIKNNVFCAFKRLVFHLAIS